MTKTFDFLPKDAKGFYLIETVSGSALWADLDNRALLRFMGAKPPEPGYLQVQFEQDGWMRNVTYVDDIRVGETVRVECDPPMNWYRSTPVVSIKEVEMKRSEVRHD
jgi:hypothetical protein